MLLIQLLCGSSWDEVATFMTMFYAKTESSLLNRMYIEIKSLKEAKKAARKIEKCDSLMSIIQQGNEE